VSTSTRISSGAENRDSALSLYHLLEPEVLANPYPLFRRLRSEDPVHWDHFLHAWVVTRYADVLEVLLNFSADRTPTPAQLEEMGLSSLTPIARVMVKQMLFLDAPSHTRLRGLSAKAFTPARVEQLRGHIRDIVNNLLDGIQAKGGGMDVIADLAEPLPAIVTAEMLGVPTRDHLKLKEWSADFAEMLGNFQHNPERYPQVLKSVANLTEYFQNATREQREHPREGLIYSLMTAEIDGDRLTEEEVIANCIVTMVGGQETTTNLIGNGLLTLLRNPAELEKLRSDPSLIPSAVEEMLRYESPSQHTARMCPSDREMGGKLIKKRQAVIAVMAAANRDPERFPDPDRFDIARKDNRHLAFGYAAHFCFGAPLARVEGQLVFEALLRRFADITLEPQAIEWRSNLGLRGLKSLRVLFGENVRGNGVASATLRQEHQTPAAETGRRLPDSAPASCPHHAQSRRERLKKYLSERRATASLKVSAIEPRPQNSRAPVSPAQEELIRRESRPGVAPLYNECITLRMKGPLDVPALEKSFSEIIRRHEIWRSTFQAVNGRLMQISRAADPVALPIIDLQDFPAAAREAEAQHRINALCREPFELQSSPPLRPALVRMDENEHRFYLVAHQLLLDGMSAYQIFPSELAVLYKAFSAGQSSPLLDLNLQFADFAIWQRETSELEASKQITYWRKKLDGISPQESKKSQAGRQPFRGVIQKITLPHGLSEHVRNLSRQENSTLFLTLLAAFTLLLHRYSNQPDIVIGTLSPCGRERSEFKDLLGYFLNPVALRFNLEKSSTFRSLLAQAREIMCEAISNADVPIERLARELMPGVECTHNPFFRVAISLQPPMPNLEMPCRVTTMDVDSGGSPWDLYVAFIDQPEGLAARIQFNPDLFGAGRITQGVHDFQALLETLVADPGQQISQLASLEMLQ
jgi:cytochrome P450